MPNKPIDVLFLSHRYDVKSGGEKALLELIAYLVDKGLNVHVIIGSTGNIIDHLSRMGVTYSIVYLPYWAHSADDSSIFEFASLNPTVSPLLTIIDLIQTIKPKVCATNTIVVPWLAYAAAITNTPHIWMVHEVNASFDFKYALGKEKTYQMIDMLSDQIIYNSSFTAASYTPHMVREQEPLIVYPIGDILRPENISSPFKKSSLKLICIGGIKQQKAQFDAIKAVKILSQSGIDVQLLIVGSVENSAYNTTINAYIDTHNLHDNVLFTGQVHNPSSYIAHSDILLSCAVNESFGRVIVEGMLLGVPAIGARSAGTTEVISSDTIGRLYTPGDSKELAEKILEISSDKKELKLLGMNARKTARALYTKEKNYGKVLKYLKQPQTRKSLDLSMLLPTFTDFSRLVEQFNHTRVRLETLEKGRVNQAYAIAKRIAKKAIRK